MADPPVRRQELGAYRADFRTLAMVEQLLQPVLVEDAAAGIEPEQEFATRPGRRQVAQSPTG